ncbi:histidine kinase [Maribacter sp.]|nr:histidine kinase [Maribacter sp.]
MLQKGNRIAQYWQYQLVGWSLASLYWAYNFYYKADYSLLHTVTNFVFDVLVGVALTHSYKLIIKKTKGRSLKKISILQLVVAVLLLAFLFMVLNNIKWQLYEVYVKGGAVDVLGVFVHWDQPLITGLRLMSIWVLAYHLHHYYSRQLIITKSNAELSIHAKQVQLNHLSKQLKPHFLFNSLNSVKSLIAEDPIKARRAIDLLSEILRSSIYTKESLITIAEELQLVNDYIELEKIRFEKRLMLETTIDESLLEYKIPSLMIQTLVENGVKYGIQNSVKGGTIVLSISKSKDRILIEVQNPGELLYKEEHDTGLGLKNLRKRLYLQYNDQASFTLKEIHKELIVAKLTIPIQTNS